MLMSLFKWVNKNIVFAGGGEELHWTLSILFDAMGALSSKYNDNPQLHQELMILKEMVLLFQEVVEH